MNNVKLFLTDGLTPSPLFYNEEKIPTKKLIAFFSTSVSCSETRTHPMKKNSYYTLFPTKKYGRADALIHGSSVGKQHFVVWLDPQMR